MTFDKDYYFGTPNVISISSICEKDLAKAIRQSDYIRNETLRRCLAIPSYRSKPLRWKNKYYELIKKRVIAELEEGKK